MWFWAPLKTQSVSIRLGIVSRDDQPDVIEPALVVDGSELSAFDYGPLDLTELKRSLQSDGTYFIWTCWCGYPGCAGLVHGVAVRHRDGRVMWHDRDGKKRYAFDAPQLQQSLATALAEGRALLSTRRGLVVVPEQNASWFDVAGTE